MDLFSGSDRYLWPERVWKTTILEAIAWAFLTSSTTNVKTSSKEASPKGQVYGKLHL
jgi:hypothetical protein